MRTVTLIAGFLISWGIFHPIQAEERPRTGDLTILVTGFRSSAGHAMIKVMNSENAMTNEDKSFSVIKSRIVGNRVEIVLKGVPYGHYAVAVFHDRNDNDVLDKNIMGVPKEEYGFSNNARGKVGAPDYSSMKFDFSSPTLMQQIIIK